jgi:hypothetical protein
MPLFSLHRPSLPYLISPPRHQLVPSISKAAMPVPLMWVPSAVQAVLVVPRSTNHRRILQLVMLMVWASVSAELAVPHMSPPRIAHPPAVELVWLTPCSLLLTQTMMVF